MKAKVTDGPAAAWLVAAQALLALDAFDWADLARQRQRADDVGHIFDPTGYRALMADKNAARNLELAKAIAALLAQARASHPDLFAVFEASPEGASDVE